MRQEPESSEFDDLLRRYLWEHDPARLTWDGNRHTIVAKLLEAGGWDAVRWLRAHLSPDELREFLVQRRGREPGRLGEEELLPRPPLRRPGARPAAPARRVAHGRQRGASLPRHRDHDPTAPAITGRNSHETPSQTQRSSPWRARV